MPTALTNGVTTYYRDEGRACPEPGRRGPPVVLIHGHSADRRLWQPQIRPLVEAGYRVVRYDVRGHGRTSVPASGYTWANYVADLAALLDGLAIEAAHLIGLSMGGAVALCFAIDYPQRCRSLVLMDSALPGFHYSSEFSASIEAMVQAARKEGPRAALERLWLNHPLFDGVRRHPKVFRRLRQMVLAYPAADYLDDAPPPADQPEAIDRLDEVDCPTLVMVGERDLPDFQAIATILGENIPRARKMEVPDAGHVPNLERPEAVNDAILRFLADVS